MFNNRAFEEEPVEKEPVKKEPGQQPPRDDPAPEDTTPPTGTIDTLAATDDAAGQLLLTWTAPAAPDADPTDYHVNWAKSAEDYPADTAEAGNAHPTGTTHTLTGLEYDTEYNIRVRARYTDGENADSPWNGPWTETTAQVKLPLPMTLNIMGAAVSPESQVFLFWSDPSNDSITGYQILRGPDAANLVVIEEDTGSSSTSYTDTTPPAGETHTYGVKARNPTGLSELSNTVTATVPAAKKEKVLIVARHESNDDTLVSNLGQTTSGGIGIGPYQGNQFQIATSFTTGDNALGYHPTGAQLDLTKFDPVSPAIDVSIREDNAGTPSDTVLASLTTTTAITTNFQLITFTTSDEITLQPNTKYWLYVTATVGTPGLRETTSDKEDTQSQADWHIANTGVARIGTEPWATASLILKMSILGHGISPDPSDDTLVSNYGQIHAGGLRLGAQGRLAQSFMTANTRPGQKYRLGSVRISAGTEEVEPITVDLYSDDDGLPGTNLVSMFVPDDFVTDIMNRLEDFVAIAPRNTLLSAGTQYWIVVGNEHEGTDDSSAFSISTTESKAEDSVSLNDWTIGDRKVTASSTSPFLAGYSLAHKNRDLRHTNSCAATNGRICQ